MKKERRIIMYRGPVDYFCNQEWERQAEADYSRAEDNDRQRRESAEDYKQSANARAKEFLDKVNAHTLLIKENK